jgi:hypothetical protein
MKPAFVQLHQLDSISLAVVKRQVRAADLVPEWNSDPSKIRTDVFYLLSGSGSNDD